MYLCDDELCMFFYTCGNKLEVRAHFCFPILNDPNALENNRTTITTRLPHITHV